jgi:uncharacterized membrane protein YfcA
VSAGAGLLADAPVLGGVIAFSVGVLTAILNVAAGGGSLLTVPLLVELGLGAQVANATNRIAVLVQGVSSATTFARHRILPVRATLRAMPAVGSGAIVGAWLASVVPDEQFRIALAVLFAAMGVVMLLERVDPNRSAERAERALSTLERPPPLVDLGLFAIGVYGGFIQAGTGILILFLTHLALGLDLRRANAMKMALTFGFNVLTLGVFAFHGLVDVRAALWLSLGAFTGGWLGARLAGRIDLRWLRRALIVGVFVAAARFAGWI